MKEKCKLIIHDEVNCEFEGLSPAVRRACSNKLKFFIEAARHTPAFKLGRWDGYIRYFHLNGCTYTNLLEHVLPIVIENNYEIEIIDNRKKYDFEFPIIDEEFLIDNAPNSVWPKGHPCEGENILLRPHQVDCLNSFTENTRSLGEISTGAGKCLAFETNLTLKINEDIFKRSIGDMITELELIENFKLEYGKEQEIKSDIFIPTPKGFSRINFVIKKKCNGLKITFESGEELICADTHILFKDNKEIYAKDLKAGDVINGIHYLRVKTLESNPTTDFYDIGIDSPHQYYDYNGILHHNTIISACMSILGEPYGRTLVIVPSRDLVKQTQKDYELLGLDVGVFYGSKKELDKTHTICTWQALESWNKTTKTKDGDDINDFAKSLSTIIVDECHQAKSNVLQKLLAGTFKNVPIRWGISGTIPKDLSILYSLNAVIGPIVTNVKARDLMDKGILSDCNINILQTLDHGEYDSYQSELKFLISDSDRLDWISEFIKNTSETGNTVVLYTRIETGEELHNRIPESYLVHGAVKSEDREDAYETINDSDKKIVIASYGVASTGLNLPRIFNLVLIEPGKSFVRVIQSIGRGIRKAKDKNHVEIYDICSTLKYSKKHLTTRKKLYEEAGYPYKVKKVDYLNDLFG